MPKPKGPFFNIDSDNYFFNVHSVEMEDAEAQLKDYVETLKMAGCRSAIFCVNARKTNYDSLAWEPYWKGYDPRQGVSQKLFEGISQEDAANWDALLRKMEDFHSRGLDYPALALKHSREKGISPWLSVRMNDIHYGDKTEHPFHSSFIKSHPEFMRKTAQRNYFSNALDYGRAEVRNHFKSLIAEILERYAMDGLELDFMREPFLFSEGCEASGRQILTSWLKNEIRPLVEAAGKRNGHKIWLGVRLPSDPKTAFDLGFDFEIWANESLVDLIVPTPRWATLEFDMPFAKWKALLPEAAALAGGIEVLYRPHEGLKPQELSQEIFRGAASAALYAGAESVYLFNFFPGGHPNWPKESFIETLKDAASLDALLAKPRVHALSYRDILAPGEKCEAPLPFAGNGTLEIMAAPIAKGSTLLLRTGFKGKGSSPEIKADGKLFALSKSFVEDANGLEIHEFESVCKERRGGGRLSIEIKQSEKPRAIESLELHILPRP